MQRTTSRLPKWTALVAAGTLVSVRGSSASAADPMPERTHAAEPPAPPVTEIVARERPSTRSFYGWQILATGEAGGIVGAASTVLVDSPMKTLPSTIGFLFGMPLYVLGGPATHWTHGGFHKGLISLGANVAIPVVSGVVGQSVRCAPSDAPYDCGAKGFFTGFSIALVTVPVVDALVLGWEDIPDDDPVAASKPAGQFTIAPVWSVGPKGDVAVGVTGRF